METKLESIIQYAKKDNAVKFTPLAHFINKEFLKKCFQELKENKAPGVDEVTIKEYQQRCKR